MRNYFIFIINIWLFWGISFLSFATETHIPISLDETYTEIYKVQQELALIKQRLNLTETIERPKVTLQISPRHSWQKIYQILFKLNHVFEKYGFPPLNIPSREPEKNMSNDAIYEQVIRLHTEFNLLKQYLGVTAFPPPPPVFTQKTDLDNYNALNAIFYDLDALANSSFTPSHVFGQTMRIHEDIDALLYFLEITDTTLPNPKKINSTPADVFNTGLELVREIQELQKNFNIKMVNLKTDVYQDIHTRKITPTEAFGMTGLILAELQVLKAHLGLELIVTPAARFYQDKIPADSRQILEWNISRIQLIKKFHH
ncbi:hypothetical protein BegalDRAFT_0024 [Beggiatoa alba B18LD]|uniref:Uncharacterized protein n=1 Tax=Beggiatoa alba B18LD TaxID=395493 RepID=I3CBF8_9GAMM|nr:hypothetical protein [Beggiatoa alba]EIJ40951.1 hypothetical protein BegalDRAFT_0024 [Beggiatoa alba B18LD]